jgi:AmmeMemoRadiSam system protein B
MGLKRDAAVAGYFYPADRQELADAVDRYLADAAPPPAALGAQMPKAIIAPHAGFVYSGPIAAAAYGCLRSQANTIRRVVLLGPAHRVALHGLAASRAEAFTTPLGDVEVDRTALQMALELDPVSVCEEAHAEEHSLEVQLPFLQRVLPSFSLVPLAVGDATTAHVAAVLERLWGGVETLIVVSSDLSHYNDYATACRMDRETTRAIECLEPELLDRWSACGRVPIRGLLSAARAHGLRTVTIDVRNSSDTAGGRDEVVGYGAWAFARLAPS